MQLEKEQETIYLDENLDVFVDDQNVKLIVQKNTQDPFESVDITKQSRKIRRKFNVLSKRYEGVEGVKSKYEDPERVNGYGIFGIVIPPYDLDGLSALFDENPTLRAVVEARVMNTVGIGYSWGGTLKAQKRVAKNSGDEGRADKIRAEHQKEQEKLDTILEDFNQDETFTETMIKVWMDALALGTGYLEIGRNRAGKVGYIGHIPSRFVRIRKERDGFVQLTNSSKRAIFFRNFGETDMVDPVGDDPNPNELIAFKIYSPNNAYYGIPPSVSAIAAIVGDKFAKEYNIDFFENKAVPRYAIILKGVKLSAQSKKEVIAYFKNELKGKNHGTLVIPLPATIGNASADVEFHALENKIQDASFENYRKMNREEIVLAYRVPPTKVAILEGANLAMARDADKTFKTQVIGPDQQIIAKKVNKVIAEFSDLFRIEFKQIDMVDEDLQSRIHDRYLRTKVIVPNEVREDIGLPALEGGDVPLPYPVEAQLQISEQDAKLKDKQIQMQGKQADNQAKIAEISAKQGGAPPGNVNAGAANPPKSKTEAGSTNSNAHNAGTNQEKGQGQDTAGVKERK